MRVIIKSIFKDKNTKVIYKIGQELEVNKKRYKEIEDFVEVIKRNDFTKGVNRNAR